MKVYFPKRSSGLYSLFPPRPIVMIVVYANENRMFVAITPKQRFNNC